MPSSSLIAHPIAWERAADGLANDPDELSFYLPTDDVSGAALTAAPQTALYTADWTATGGAWETATNWTVTDPGEPAQSVPGADDVGRIGDNGASGYTITYNSTDTIAAIKSGTVVGGAPAAKAPLSGDDFVTLVSFDGGDGEMPEADSLLIDANGDLFGTTVAGGDGGLGTVFEIVNTASGYANTPETLVDFNRADGWFSFSGLIIGSVLYSLPFAVQPLTAGFRAIDAALIEQGRLLGAGRLRILTGVFLPLSVHSVVAASALCFTHTVGEFGVVLMIGGDIPGTTRTLSIAIYDQVQEFSYSAANRTSLLLVCISACALILLYTRRARVGAPHA